MRRTTLLVVCLSLAFLSFVPLTAPVAAQSALPAEFVGRWQGTVIQVNPNAEYPATIDLTGGDVGLVVGTSDYPSFGCGGGLTLQGVASDGRQVELLEELTKNAAGTCFGGGAIMLSLLADDSLAFAWTQPNYTGGPVTGSLLRSGSSAAAPIPAEPAANEANGDQESGQFEGSTRPLPGAFVVPDPVECTVAPRTAESFPALVDSPDVAMAALAEAIATPGFVISEGAPVDPMMTAGVVDTYRQFTACSNAGDELAAFALWTDDALRQLTIEPPTDAPVPSEPRIAFRVSDVRMLPDGRVVAVFDLRAPVLDTFDESTLVQVLARQGDHFLVAETLDIVLPADSGDALLPEPDVTGALPEPFLGQWEGTVAWDTMTMPVALNLTGGSVGEVVGSVEYALYGINGPKCGGDVTLQDVDIDGRQIDLSGTITYDPSVCLIDATVTISLDDTGAVGYLWNHPALTVTGTGTLIHIGPTN